MPGRVFAIASATTEVVLSYGFGDHVGDRPRPARLFGAGHLNPCIVLDAGGVVWGCECWWGPAERWEEFKAGRRVEVVAAPGSPDEAAPDEIPERKPPA